jgi:hypothetical protein
MTGSDADKTDNYLLVNESTADSANYVGSALQGDLDTYTMGDLGSTNYDIVGVQTTVWAAASDVGSKYIRPIVRTGTTGGAQSDNAGTSVVLTTAYNAYDEAWGINPATSTSWTEGEITAMEVGQEARDS